MQIKRYNHLPEEASRIRQKVFCQEQGFDDEFDDIDAIATHVVLFDADKPVATCRIFPGEVSGTYILGRLAVSKEYRGRDLGLAIVQDAEKAAKEKGAGEMMLHAQCQAKGFYEKAGYQTYGEIEDEQGCPHIWMRKNL